MLFELGEKVDYRHYGAATITEMETRTARGEKKASTVLDEVLAP